MNSNLKLQCEVCKNVVLLKVYGGYVHENSFTFSCPKCNVTVSGYLIWNENLDEGMVKEFKCKNATYVHEGSPTHVLQLATEFFTDKIKQFDPNDITSFFPPYMLEVSKSRATQQKKTELVSMVSDGFENEANISFRIWELYKNNKHAFLISQLIQNEYVKKPTYALENLKIDYSDIIKQVLYRPFSFLFIEDYYRIQDLQKKLLQLKSKNLTELQSLKKDLSELITYSDENIIQLLKNFSIYFELLWPIILTYICGPKEIDKIKETKGILTTNFDMLKNYYVESFEILSSILPIFLGIQNIYLRGNRNDFETETAREFKDIHTINEYNTKMQNKGNRLKYFTKENIFLPLLDPNTLNNSIRNSIGHHSYEYEADNQLIKFNDRSKSWDLYLIEFGDLLFKTIYTAFAAFEIIMFLKHEVPE
ncbi:hypothetical protein [Paenibacillus monticola]|uniref:Uncharacterized protein n=1 Tax=Paenibacillus monticola TaxID=2666075 RepID=A0A7X2HB25_9BACL|nr:hypothetical protein [Paenibacillus monticola]MRN56817.1 hypothetical protein [Paenibacillus monticola]